MTAAGVKRVWATDSLVRLRRDLRVFYRALFWPEGPRQRWRLFSVGGGVATALCGALYLWPGKIVLPDSLRPIAFAFVLLLVGVAASWVMVPVALAVAGTVVRFVGLGVPPAQQLLHRPLGLDRDADKYPSPFLSALRFGICGPLSFFRLTVAGVAGVYAMLLTDGEWIQLEPPTGGSSIYPAAAAILAPALFGAINRGTLSTRSVLHPLAKLGVANALLLGVAGLVFAASATATKTEASLIEWGLIVAGCVIAVLSYVGPAFVSLDHSYPLISGYERKYCQDGDVVSVNVTSEVSPTGRYQLPMRYSKSLRGFEWGNCSGGAFDLSRAVLADALGWSEPDDQLVVDFMRQVVRDLPKSGPWEIELLEVAEWLAGRARGIAVLPAAADNDGARAKQLDDLSRALSNSHSRRAVRRLKECLGRLSSKEGGDPDKNHADGTADQNGVAKEESNGGTEQVGGG